jgi:predicted dehydrogenase
MKIGIIGTGTIAEIHARANQITGGALVMVADVAKDRADRFAAKWNTKAAVDVSELLAQRLDLVIVGVPNPFHFDIARQAIEAGHAVLCEKPMTGSAAKSKELAEIAQRGGRPFFVGYMKRAHPAGQHFYEYVQRIGTIRTGLVRVYLPCGMVAWQEVAEHLAKDPNDPRHRDGILANCVSHMADLLLWAAGPVKRVIGARLGYQPGCAPVDCTAHALLEMQNGASIMIDAAFLPLSGIGKYGNGWDELVELRGDAGLARITNGWWDRPETEAPVAELWDEQKKAWEVFRGQNVDWFVAEHRLIAQALKGEIVRLAGAQDGLRIDQLIEDVYKAAGVRS